MDINHTVISQSQGVFIGNLLKYLVGLDGNGAPCVHKPIETCPGRYKPFPTSSTLITLAFFIFTYSGGHSGLSTVGAGSQEWKGPALVV